MLTSCPSAPPSTSYWPRWLPTTSSRARPKPFIILFDGSAGSSWFADALDRHPSVFISGYESLEWVGHDRYVGYNASSWQPAWLQTVWVDTPPGTSTWDGWLKRYYRNEKLDPAKHHAPLTVRTPTQAEVARATAVGFKVRPQTVAENYLNATLKEALRSLDGVVLVINRNDKLAQAVSLYRRRFDGKAGQFAAQKSIQQAHAAAAARRVAEFADLSNSSSEGGGPIITTAAASTSTSSASSASVIPLRELEKMLEHREAQEQSIECLAEYLDRPTLRVSYEDLLSDFNGVMRKVLAHVHVTTGLDEQSISALNEPPPSSPPAASSSGSSGGTGFVKRSPSSLCMSVANLGELCTALSKGRYAKHVAARIATGGCECADASNHTELSYAGASEYPSNDKGAELLLNTQGGTPPMLAVVGTHHKSGTVLMGQVLRVTTGLLSGDQNIPYENGDIEHFDDQGDKTSSFATAKKVELIRRSWTQCVDSAAKGGRAVCLLEHARWPQLGTYIRRGLRYVHMIRDPVEICVSGYQYHLNTTESWVLQPRTELGGLSWQSYLRSLSVDDGIIVECTRALGELRDMVELYDKSKTCCADQVTVLRLEDVSTNYTTTMSKLFDALLPPLQTNHTGGHFQSHLLRAVAKFDLGRNAPMPDKVAHVSSKDDKQHLRDVLQRDPKLRPLLKGMRQALDYERRPPWQPPPDVERLSSAIENVSKVFWKSVSSGRLRHRLRAATKPAPR